ncbi:MAG: YebC/PmpR family DNA-binding transcriptional regulator [Patescibacteria group bacterium]|nr:YebC/PmpR family DNA-binding transcriptional regulator [Patescibacteria group bacterium]
MSGHSKWSQIKRKKGVNDSKKANQFTKLANIIIVAAKAGKGLSLAVERAKAANMPNEKINNAIARGQGKIAGAEVVETYYEAYGPAGVAIIIKIITDNKNRSLSDIRSLMNKMNGRIADSGSVSYLFEQKGVIEINIAGQTLSKDDLEMVIIDSGADNYEESDGKFYIYTNAKKLEEVKRALEFKTIKIESAKLEMLPKNYIAIADDKKQLVIDFLSELEELDDVEEVYTNANL